MRLTDSASGRRRACAQRPLVARAGNCAGRLHLRHCRPSAPLESYGRFLYPVRSCAHATRLAHPTGRHRSNTVPNRIREREGECAVTRRRMRI